MVYNVMVGKRCSGLVAASAGARPTETEVTVDETRMPVAGDGFYAASNRKAHDELLQAAERALSWLDSRRAHYPPQMRDGREGVHGKALREAIRKVRAGE
jgi:hypothetical protein